MSYIGTNPESYNGKVAGNGQCVAFVRECANAPQASLWSEGAKVKDTATIRAGTAIATFNNGVYMNAKTGNHAAIYISHDATGINVWDQWFGQPVHQRKIRFQGGKGSPSNDGDTYSIIE